MTSFSCPPVYVKRAIVDIEEQMRKSLAHFLNSLHVEVVQNIKINHEKFYRQHFIFFPSLFKTRHSNVSLLKSIGFFIFLLCLLSICSVKSLMARFYAHYSVIVPGPSLPPDGGDVKLFRNFSRNLYQSLFSAVRKEFSKANL